jgi:hypothetical protein
MPELDEKKRIIAYDTVNDPDENYYALIDNGTSGTGKVSIKGLGPANMISDQYSDSSTYKVGDLCIHNNKLYVCTVAINTPHAFNLSEWELDTLGNYASEIKQSLANLDNIFSKSYTITASSERAFIKDLATQAYSYMISKSLPFILVNASWEGNNTGYMIISSTRRFQVQIGDSMSLGILNAAGTDLAQLRSVTTTAHP